MSNPTRHANFQVHEIVQTTNVEVAQRAVRRLYPGCALKTAPGAKPLDARVETFHVGTSMAGRTSLGSGAVISADDAEGFYVNVPRTGSTVSRSGTQRPVHTTPTQGVIFSPGGSIEIACTGDCVQLCLALPVLALERELEELIGRSLTQPIRFSFGLDFTTPGGRNWRSALALIDLELDNGPGMIAHPTAGGHLEQFLIEGLLFDQRHNYSYVLAGPGQPAALGSVRQAIDLLEERPSLDWTTAGLAGEIFVSVRALQEGFRRNVGVPPMTYLRDVRLRRVHDDLSTAPRGSVTVNDVASRWGFQHMSRFAGAYRVKFGTTPSVTLHDD